MAQNGYSVIDADTHILEPPNIWKNHLPKEYQKYAPRLVRDHEGGDAWDHGTGSPDPIGLVSTFLRLESSGRVRSVVLGLLLLWAEAHHGHLQQAPAGLGLCQSLHSAGRPMTPAACSPVSLRSVRAVTANPPLTCFLGSGPDRSACCRSSGGRIASAPPAGDRRRVLIGCVLPGEMPGFDAVDHSCTSVWAGRCAATIGLV